MYNALREWRDLPDGVSDGTAVCGLIEHTMCCLDPASKKSAQARLLRL